MSGIHELIRNIDNGRDLDTNLPLLFRALADSYLTTQAVQAAYTCETLYLEAQEKGRELNDREKRIAGVLSSVTEDLSDTRVRERVIKELYVLRKELISRGEDLDLTGSLVLNHMSTASRRLGDGPEVGDTDDLARDILRFIFGDEDNTVINQRIQDMFTYIPLSMTKGKFLDLVTVSYQIFRESDERALAGFDYAVRSAAGLGSEEAAARALPEEGEVFESLKGSSYKDMPAEEIRRVHERLQDLLGTVNTAVEENIMDISAVNALLSLLMVMPYASEEPDAHAVKLLSETAKALSGAYEESVLFNAAVSEDEVALEGVQEDQFTRQSRLEACFEGIRETEKERTAKLSLDVEADNLAVCGLLAGESQFAELDVVLKDAVPCTEASVEAKKAAIEADLSALMADHDRDFRRSMMAGVLSVLPVFFNDQNEVMNFVRDSLSACRNREELRCAAGALQEHMRGEAGAW